MKGKVPVHERKKMNYINCRIFQHWWTVNIRLACQHCNHLLLVLGRIRLECFPQPHKINLMLKARIPWSKSINSHPSSVTKTLPLCTSTEIQCYFYTMHHAIPKQMRIILRKGIDKAQRTSKASSTWRQINLTSVNCKEHADNSTLYFA